MSDRGHEIFLRFAGLPNSIRFLPRTMNARILTLQLDSYITTFEHAVALREFSNSQIDLRRAQLKERFWGTEEDRKTNFLLAAWEQLAGRDGASSLYHFRHTMNDLNNALCSDPILRPLVNKDQLGRARDLLNKFFPRIESIRNATQHSAEMAREQQVEKHSFKGTLDGDALQIGAGARVVVQGTMIDGKYSVTYNGELLSYALNASTVQQLVEIERCMLAALPQTCD